MARHLTMSELAELAGVSTSTVSRVFSGSPNISKATAERVRRIASSHGFRPDPLMCGALGGKTRSVGVFVCDLRISYFADILAGLQAELIEADHLPVTLDSRMLSERAAVRRLLDHRVDGMVITAIDEVERRTIAGEIRRKGLPLVIVDSPRGSARADFVGTDDAGGGGLAGEHLTSLGHRRLGFCRYGEGDSTCEARLEGFRRSLADAGLVLRRRDIARAPARGADPDKRLRRDLRRILSRKDRPTAVFAPTDLLALAVYKAAGELGLSVPGDLSVVGFADLNWAEHIEPPLTTVRQDGESVGREAARAILARLATPDAEETDVRLPVRLVRRGSTARPPAKR